MNEDVNSALHRLALVDPARSLTAVSTAEQTALLARILAEAPEPADERRRFPARRVAIAGIGIAAAAAVAIAGVVTTPGNHGSAPSSAYGVTRQDGAIDVSIRFDELSDPAALNAELQAVGARMVVMEQATPGTCRTPVPGDPAHPRTEFVTPWISTGGQGSDAGANESVFTVHPDLIPAGDTLMLAFTRVETTLDDGSPSGFESLEIFKMLVPHVPACVPANADSITTENGISIR